jgi:hypothetical protein
MFVITHRRRIHFLGVPKVTDVPQQAASWLSPARQQINRSTLRIFKVGIRIRRYVPTFQILNQNGKLQVLLNDRNLSLQREVRRLEPFEPLEQNLEKMR